MAGVPSNIIIPFVGIDFDNSGAVAGPSEVPVNLLIIGQRLSTGAIPELQKYLASTPDEVAANSGFGSMAHRQALKAFQNNGTVPITFLTFDDPDTGTAATYAITFSGTVDKAGTLILYVAGIRYAVAANVGDTSVVLSDALAAAINGDQNSPVTAVSATSILTLTVKCKGLAAGDLDVRFNYNKGEKIPSGITASVPVVTPGTLDPDITDALAIVGDDWFNVMTQPYTDNTNMNVLETFLLAQADVMIQKDMFSYQTIRDTRSALITYGTDVANRNNQWTATYPAYQRLESTYELAAGIAAAVANSIQSEDAAVPLHRMFLYGFDVLDSNDRWTSVERNELAKSSIATLTDERGVQTEASVTMYRENSAGAADRSYQQQNTMFTLSALRYRFRNQILSKYPRAKLATAADNIGPGQQLMTPAIGEAEAIIWFKQAQTDGLVDASNAALEQFKSELVVRRNDSNENRLDWLLPPDLMNQFIVGSAVMRFKN